MYRRIVQYYVRRFEDGDTQKLIIAILPDIIRNKTTTRQNTNRHYQIRSNFYRSNIKYQAVNTSRTFSIWYFALTS